MSLLLEKPSTTFAPYREAIVKLGERDVRVVVLGADLANSTEIDGFKERFPERFFNLGVAEQNAVGIAAGMAFEGLVPIFHSFGVFATRRPYEQVCIQAAMERSNVKLVGALPGLSSRLGPTHQAIDDLSLMRTLPNMVVVDPADATEMVQALDAIAAHDGPCYMRMMRREVPVIFDPGKYRFVLGRAVEVEAGVDVTILTTGSMLAVALEASDMLREEGKSATILHVPTIKPLDGDAILDCIRVTGCAVTVENHLITGGLGSAVAELLAEERPAPLVRVGIEDRFASAGTPEYLFEMQGLCPVDVAAAAAVAMQRRG